MLDSFAILIVEDELLIAETLRYSLEDLGFSVSGIANTYDQAITCIDQLRPDLTLLDINLNSEQPDNNGLALANRLANQYRLPFIFLTAYSDRDTILQATRLRPSGYLIKPVSPAALFATIQTTIEHQLTPAQPIQSALQLDEQPDFFFVKVGNRNIKLYWQDVYCLEASKNYVQIRVIDTSVTYMIRGTLNFVWHQLIPASIQPGFRQFNRSTVASVKHLTHFDPEAVYHNQFRITNTRFNHKELQSLLGGPAYI